MGMVKYLVVILLLIPSLAFADTHNAASCKVADVSTAITASANGDTVTIPTCEGTDGTWASGITVTKNITIQGAGYSNTVITRNGTAFKLTDTSTRITGIGFIMSSGDKQIDVNGGSGWRIDHCQFTNPTTSSLVSIYVNSDTSTSAPYGLIDNNDFQGGRITTSLASNATEARAIWAAEHPFGSADTTGLHTVYIEDNTFTKTWDSNCIDGSAYTGVYVARYNAVTGSQFHVHSLQDANNRGTKAWEMYGNTFTASSSRWAAIWARSGTGYIFNNTISGSYSYNVIFDNIRSFQSITTAGQCNGSSNWDGNTLANGHPCRDQIGRGKDTSLWTTENPYPAQASQPAYLWSNFDTGVAVTAYIHNSCGAWILADRDYYEPGATNGVRCGKLANIPETCTTGQAYWATNQSCTDMTGMVGVNPSKPISGSLYKCTSTDTWTESYTPLVYPHPLREESGGDTTAPTLVSATIAANGTSLSLVFSESVTVNTNTGFVLTATGSPTLAYVSGTGTATLVYTISAAVQQSESGITLAYTTGANYIEDAAGNDLGSFTGTAVVNHSTQNTPPTVELTVTKTGSGCTVTSAPSGVNCGSTCTLSVDNGTAVTLSGYSENGWNAITYGGDCAANGTVTMNAAKECTATCTQVYLFP
jgi:hypothetical protein